MSAQPGNVIPFPTKLRTSVQSLPDGDKGIQKTISAMQRLAVGTEGALNPAMRALAVQIVRGTPARDDYAQAAAIFAWVKANIEFRGEYDELLQTPLVTAQFRAGDCDDHATLVYALLRAIGIRAEFITVATEADQQFSHVYTSAFVREQNAWLPLDTTVDRSYPGWKPEKITRIAVWGNRGLGAMPTTTPAGANTLNTFLTHLDPLVQAAQERIAYGSSPSGTAYIQTGSGQRIAIGGGLAVSPQTLVIGGLALVFGLALLRGDGRRR